MGKEFMNNLKKDYENIKEIKASEMYENFAMKDTEEISWLIQANIDLQCIILEALNCTDYLIHFSKIQ